MAHTLGAITGSAGLPRMLVDYESLLRDPQAALERLSRFLRLPVDAAERAVFCNDFLDADLCHHTPTALPADPDAPTDQAPWGALALRICTALRPDPARPAPLDDMESSACTRAVGGWLAAMRQLPPPPLRAPGPEAQP